MAAGIFVIYPVLHPAGGARLSEVRLAQPLTAAIRTGSSAPVRFPGAFSHVWGLARSAYWSKSAKTASVLLHPECCVTN